MWVMMSQRQSCKGHRDVSLTVLIDWNRLKALVQNHQRAGGIKADPSHLAPLHTLSNFLKADKTIKHDRCVEIKLAVSSELTLPLQLCSICARSQWRTGRSGQTEAPKWWWAPLQCSSADPPWSPELLSHWQCPRPLPHSKPLPSWGELNVEEGEEEEGEIQELIINHCKHLTAYYEISADTHTHINACI